MNYGALHTAISFDGHGFFALELDGELVSWMTPAPPEPPEEETVVQHVDNGVICPASLIVVSAPEAAE
jgi:hypothetical protein